MVMHPIVKMATALGALLPLASFAPPATFSAASLEALNPSRLAALSCGARRAGSALARELLIASAVAAPASRAAPIPLYPDLTLSRFPATTAHADARRYFSQGLLLTYGFNHAGAVRSFREAQRRDPGCAICWWGEALALGPNINAPMDARDHAAALAALDRAVALRGTASSLEQALIDALAHRYARDAAADRAALDAAYADAMLDVARRFPAADDVAVLAAEAAMNTSPWDYWEADKSTARGRSGAAVELVETVLRRSPDHVQANHLYIHLMESRDPARAEAAADRLANPLAPSAAHLVHMPGHIYQQRGRHADSIRVNIAAARADEAYIKSAGDEGLVRYAYYPHNIHFIVTSAQMAGDVRTAIREARRLGKVLNPETSVQIAWIQAIDAAPFFAMAQFAEPRAILAMAPPDPRLAYPTAMRHYARAIAHARLGDRAAFDREMAAMAQLRQSDAFAPLVEQGFPAPDLASLAEAVARGRFAAARGRHDDAIALFEQAITIEARLPYQEPTYWYFPVHQSLGAALYRAGRFDDASAAFRTALARTPHNGWALYGLSRSEAARGHRLEAAAAEKAMAAAWLGDRNWLRMDRL